MNRPEPVEMKCKHCEYGWTTMSTMDNVSCPNCLKKTPKPTEEEIDKMIEEQEKQGEEQFANCIEHETPKEVHEDKPEENVRETYDEEENVQESEPEEIEEPRESNEVEVKEEESEKEEVEEYESSGVYVWGEKEK